jgi:hypothetical protein
LKHKNQIYKGETEDNKSLDQNYISVEWWKLDNEKGAHIIAVCNAHKVTATDIEPDEDRLTEETSQQLVNNEMRSQIQRKSIIY